MSDERYYTKIHESLVSKETKAIAQEALDFVAMDLGLDPITPTWFTSIDEGTAKAQIAGCAERGVSCAVWQRGELTQLVYGMVYTETGELTLCKDAMPDLLARCAIHEARHVWQNKNWKTSDDKAAAEADAERYTNLVYPEVFNHYRELKAKSKKDDSAERRAAHVRAQAYAATHCCGLR